MNFEVKHNDDIVVFKLNEKKLDTTISGILKGEFTILCQAEGVRKMIIDLSEVEFCDSSGLSALLLCQRQIRERGGAIRLTHANEKIETLVKISQLERVLPLIKTNDLAIEELQNIE
ncbi:MAG: STAS domain-containing protein [Bacteroidetes bacterium]|nr:STAS domain-containing protein [Bacteroidota bacterium]MBU2585924.1 STAS domain-containing protein [Bacteroidota bacterium]